MTAVPIPGTPFVNTPCAGGCNTTVVAVPAYADRARCSNCLTAKVQAEWVPQPGGPVPYTPPATVRHEPAVYPPSTEVVPFRVVDVEDPPAILRCLNRAHVRPVRIPLVGYRPPAAPVSFDHDDLDVRIAMRVHDVLHHDPDAWLIGPRGGANDDICAPCGGSSKDKTALVTKDPNDPEKTVTGPRHDLCLKGRWRGRGGNCPCTHFKPHMRGVKPGDTPTR